MQSDRKSVAQRLRKEATPEERHLWYDFLKTYPVQFRRQVPFGPYFLDFYCAEAKLAVELDGSQHYNIMKKKTTVDLDIPLDITANELVVALNSAYELGIDTTDMKNCYLKTERPIALLKGNKTLEEFGVRNGTVINYTE